jgi:hypothetical protein
MDMLLSKPKRDFLVIISEGYHVLFACSYMADEIADCAQGNDEDWSLEQRAAFEFIRINMLETGKSMIGLQRNWFSRDKLAESFEKIKTRADQDRMINAFEIICDLGICVSAAFAESMVELDDFKELVGAENWTQQHLSLFSAFTANKINTHDEFMRF